MIYASELEAKIDCEHILIGANMCPKCGAPMQDKVQQVSGNDVAVQLLALRFRVSDVRCSSCTFRITNGNWNEGEGWCSQHIVD